MEPRSKAPAQQRPGITTLTSLCLMFLLAACSGTPPRNSSIERDGVAVQVPRVYPGDSNEIKQYCAYIKSTEPDIARAGRVFDRCQRDENQSLNNRRRNCANLRSPSTGKPITSAERPRCYRQFTDFPKQMSLLAEYDSFANARSGQDWVTYLASYAKLNELGLAGEARKRASMACATEAPVMTDLRQRDAFMARFSVLEDTECDGKLLAARRAQYRDEFANAKSVDQLKHFIDRYRAKDYELLIPQAEAALQEAYRNEEHAAFAAAKSWEDWMNFMARYHGADVAQLIPQAEQRFEQLRHTRKAEIDALPLDELEQRYRQQHTTLPKELSSHAKQRLLTELPSLNTFDGYIRAYRLKKDFDLVTNTALLAEAQYFARSPDDLSTLERLTVEAMPNKARLIDTNFSFNAPHADLRQSSGSWFVDRNFSIPVAITGTLNVTPSNRSPIKLKHGNYSAVIALDLTLPRSFQRRSAWLGNSDSTNDLSIKKTVTVKLSPPNYKTQVPVDFGISHLASFNRGAMGGFDYTEITGEPRVSVQIQSISLSE